MERLSNSKILTTDEAQAIVSEYTAWLGESLKQVDNYVPEPMYFGGRWSEMTQASASVSKWDTGVDSDLLKFIANKSVQCEELVSENYCDFLDLWLDHRVSRFQLSTKNFNEFCRIFTHTF